jgi:lipopolysaccharide transport system ATP-binding protein
MRTYSMGMIARVAFAICAHAKADVLIVDEALSVGDEIFQRKCEKYIADFAKTGTIVMVSHNLSFLASLCDRVLWLEGGVVREMGAPAEVIQHYREFFDSDFVGSELKNETFRIPESGAA